MNIQQHENGVYLSIRVQPRASQNALYVEESGTIKVRLTTPPVDGEANTACIRLIADTFDVAKSQVTLVSGQRSRNKVINVQGIRLSRVQDILQQRRKI